ncbi:MAG: hypothetical protein K6F55_00645 [Eubacterium sp.]|nr:hypothetical protein [Eubacterium sp.]
MFKIETLRAEEEAKTLNLSEKLFHEALKYKPESKARFHVKNDKGEDFDIVYWDNDEDIEPRDTYPSYIKRPFMAKYYIYDENDKGTLYLSFFDGLSNMVFEELNEYTIAISKVILQFTDMEIWCADERILWFIDENPRLHIEKDLPDDIYGDDCFYIQEQFRLGMEDNNFKRLCSTYAFHNIFFLQWILNGKAFSQYKYMTLPIDATGGIGAILSGYKRFEMAFGHFGLKFVASDKDYFGKYPRKLMERYFAADLWDENANEDNTLWVPSTFMLIKTEFYQKMPGLMDKSVIAPSFAMEMDEYYDAVFGDKKTLGVLIRGSDYIASGLSGSRKMATVEQMVPLIHKWMNDYGYEKEHANGEYAEKLEDTTVNYFYALYLLSRCDAFMCSGQDTDAYLQVEPQNPKAAMGALLGKEAFEIPESPDDCIFVPKVDCRGFCISVPSREFMKYAKSVKGSPLSVLYVCFAEAVQRSVISEHCVRQSTETVFA